MPERGLDGRTGNAAPMLPLPSPAQQTRLDELDAAITTRESGARRRRSSTPLQARVGEDASGDSVAPIDGDGLAAHYELDGSFSDISGRYQHGRTIAGDPTFDVGQIGRAASFDGDTEVSFGNVGALRSHRAVQPRGLAARARATCRWRSSRSSTARQRRRGYEWRFDDIVLVGIQRWAARLTITLAVRCARAARFRSARASG